LSRVFDKFLELIVSSRLDLSLKSYKLMVWTCLGIGSTSYCLSVVIQWTGYGCNKSWDRFGFDAKSSSSGFGFGFVYHIRIWFGLVAQICGIDLTLIPRIWIRVCICTLDLDIDLDLYKSYKSLWICWKIYYYFTLHKL
jgi:hypothetical protein